MIQLSILILIVALVAVFYLYIYNNKTLVSDTRKKTHSDERPYTIGDDENDLGPQGTTKQSYFHTNRTY